MLTVWFSRKMLPTVPWVQILTSPGSSSSPTPSATSRLSPTTSISLNLTSRKTPTCKSYGARWTKSSRILFSLRKRSLGNASSCSLTIISLWWRMCQLRWCGWLRGTRKLWCVRVLIWYRAISPLASVSVFTPKRSPTTQMQVCMTRHEPNPPRWCSWKDVIKSWGVRWSCRAQISRNWSRLNKHWNGAWNSPERWY